MLRSSSEPSSQKLTSSVAKGLADRLTASDTRAADRLLIATPHKISVRGLAPNRSTSSNTPTAVSEPATAPAGMNQSLTAASPEYSTSTAPSAAPPDAPSSPGSASGLRVRPCRAAPPSPSMAPTASARRVRGRRISCTTMTTQSVPRPVIAASASAGGNSVSPMQSEATASNRSSRICPGISAGCIGLEVPPVPPAQKDKDTPPKIDRSAVPKPSASWYCSSNAFSSRTKVVRKPVTS